ncbi:MAG: glycosyltransferase family 2 protein [Syntrophorhabdus sp.]
MSENKPEKTVVIIPAHNEGDYIAGVVNQIRASYPYLDVVVIDDGSSDDTRTKAIVAGARVISNPFSLGYGGALQTGYKYAVKNGYQYLVQMDGDGQHDPAYIDDLIEPVRNGEADIVIGSRFLVPLSQGDNQQVYRAPMARKIGMKVFGAIATFLIGQKVTDPTSGYQAMENRVFSLLSGDKFPIDYPDADVIIMLHRAHFRIKEIPVRMLPSPDDKSMHSGLKPIYYVFKMFLSILVTLLRK